LGLEQKANQLALVVPETAAPMEALREAVDRARSALNRADDMRALVYLAYRDLAATTNARSAHVQVDRLEMLFRDLAERHKALNKVKSWSGESLKSATELFNRSIEEDEQLRRMAAENAARAREAEAERQRVLQAKLAAERLRPMIVQRELDLLDEARAANAPLIHSRKFDEAAKAIAGLQSRLTQPESKAYFQVLNDAYRDMGKLKSFLVKSIRAAPYPRGWVVANDAERDIVSADPDEGIEIALGSYGNMRVTWDKVGIQQVLMIAQHYLNAMKMSEKERAETLLGVALFCYESGEFKLAKKSVAAAYKQDSSIRREVRRLMPGF